MIFQSWIGVSAMPDRYARKNFCTRADADCLRYRVLAWVERKMRVMPQTLRLSEMP